MSRNASLSSNIPLFLEDWDPLFLLDEISLIIVLGLNYDDYFGLLLFLVLLLLHSMSFFIVLEFFFPLED